MTDFGAYGDEMARPDGLTEQEIERLVAGTGHDEGHSDLALFLADVRAQAGVDEATATRHLMALSLEAERLSAQGVPPRSSAAAVTAPTWRRVMNRSIRLAAQTAAGVAVLSASMLGLAYAGVDLPGTAAEKALESVANVELPNQGDELEHGKSVSDDVKALIESSNERGCEFGQAVSEVASQNRKGDGGSDKDPCAKDGETEDTKATAKGSKAAGEERSAKGRATAAEKSDGRSKAGAEDAGTNNDKGQTTSEEAKSKNDDDGDATETDVEDKADAKADNAGTHDDAGHNTADDAQSTEHGKSSSAQDTK